jgi:hypothetical protein
MHDEHGAADDNNRYLRYRKAQAPSLDTDPKIWRFDCGGLCKTSLHNRINCETLT